MSREKIRNIDNNIKILNYPDMNNFLADQNDKFSPLKSPLNIFLISLTGNRKSDPRE